MNDYPVNNVSFMHAVHRHLDLLPADMRRDYRGTLTDNIKAAIWLLNNGKVQVS